MSLLKKTTYKSKTPGPRILVLGAIHGNEPAGTKACEKAIEQLGLKELNKGLVTFIPVCNPAAKTHNVRYIKDNLNRIMHRHSKADTLEKDYANQICTLIENHDYVLDLHSTHIKGDLPTVFNDFVDDETIAWSNALNVGAVITSWRDMLNKSDAPADFSDTVYYAHKINRKALLVEAGYHGDEDADKIAYNAIIRTLEFFDMVDKTSSQEFNNTIAHMYKIVFKTEDGGEFTKEWRHMDEVKAGDVIAKLASGKPLMAEHDGYMIIPFPNAKVDEEWFYLAKK